MGQPPEHPPALQPLPPELPAPAGTAWRIQGCSQSSSPQSRGHKLRAASPNLTCRASPTRIRESRAHQAQQLPLLLVVALTEELPLLEHELVAFLQAPLADAAAEAAQVENAFLGSHHQLAGGDGLQATPALHGEQPAGQARGQPAVTARSRGGHGHQHHRVTVPWECGGRGGAGDTPR